MENGVKAIDLNIHKHDGEAYLTDLYPTSIDFTMNGSNSHVKVTFNINHVEFVENKKPSWEDWFIIDNEEKLNAT